MKSYAFGYRKLIVCLVAILAIWIGALANSIPGDTAAWSIVAIVSVVVTGYAGEYLFSRNAKRLENNEIQK